MSNHFKHKSASFSLSTNLIQSNMKSIHCKMLSLIIIPQRKSCIQSIPITKERKKITLIEDENEDNLNTTFQEDQFNKEGKRILAKLSNCIKEMNQGEIIIDSKKLLSIEDNLSSSCQRTTSLAHIKNEIIPTITEESFISSKREWKVSPIRKCDYADTFNQINYQSSQRYITNYNHDNYTKQYNNKRRSYKYQLNKKTTLCKDNDDDKYIKKNINYRNSLISTTTLKAFLDLTMKNMNKIKGRNKALSLNDHHTKSNRMSFATKQITINHMASLHI